MENEVGEASDTDSNLMRGQISVSGDFHTRFFDISLKHPLTGLECKGIVLPGKVPFLISSDIFQMHQGLERKQKRF